MSEMPSPPQAEKEKPLEELPEAISLDSVEAVRKAERKAHWLRTKGMREGSFDASKSLAARYDEIIDAHLQAHGIDPSDEKYSEYFEFLRDRSVDRIGDEWEVGEIDADGNRTLSQREETAHYLRNKYPKSSEAAEEDEEGGQEEEPDNSTEVNKEASDKDVENAKKVLEEYRKHYAHLLAEHSKKMGLLDPNKETKQNREDLADLIGAIATDMMDDLDAQGMSKEDRDAAIAEFIAEQTDLLIGEMEEQRLAEKRDLKGWRRWVVDKWASWEPAQGETWKERMFSGHNFKNNLKKGAVFAVPGAIAGAALAIPLGAVGAGAIATGAAILISRSIARNLGRAKLDSIAQADTIAHAQAEDIRARVTEHGDTVHTELLDLIQDRSDHYRKRNRNRFLGGTAISIAAAAGTAGLVDLLSPFTPGLFGIAGEKVGHVASNIRGNHASSGGTGDQGSGGSAGGQPPAQERGSSPLELQQRREADMQKHMNDGPKKEPDDINPRPKFEVLGGGEKTISRGEGWYQTFNEMGVSGKHHAELLKEVGPKLEDKGLAYWDDSANEWRMNMTENGKLPKSAVKLIAETANEHGWHSDYSNMLDASSADTSADTTNLSEHDVEEYAEGTDEEVISKGEGGLKFASEMGIHGTNNQYAVWNDVAPQFEDQGLTYQMPDGEWRLYMTESGDMPTEMIQAMAESAHSQGISSNYDHLFSSAAESSNGAGSADVDTSSGTNNEPKIYDTNTDPTSVDSIPELSSESGLIAPNFTINEFGSTPTEATEAYYEAFNQLDIDKTQANKLLNAVAYQFQDIKGADGVALAYKTSDGAWHFRETAELPQEAKDVLAAVADKYNWTTAS